MPRSDSFLADFCVGSRYDTPAYLLALYAWILDPIEDRMRRQERYPLPYSDWKYCLVDLAAALSAFGIVFGIEGTRRALLFLAHRLRRARYYRRENEVRRSRKPNRHIRVRTTRENPLPTPEVLLGQWLVARKRGATLEKIRLGAMLAEIESIVDNSLIRNDAHEIIGRRPGLRGWIHDNCPALRPHYKTLMRYKSMADKLQQIAGLQDPDPVLGVLPDEGAVEKPLKTTRKLKKSNKIDRVENLAEREASEARERWLKRPRMESWRREARLETAGKRIESILRETGVLRRMDSPKSGGGSLKILEDFLFQTLGIGRETRPRKAVA